MMIPFHLSDIQTFQRLHTALSQRCGTWPAVITLAGSSRPQPLAIQGVIDSYLAQLEPFTQATTYIVGGRGERGSVMDISLEGCYKRNYQTVIVGIEPIFDLGGRVPNENIFGFKNISLRCYALTQLSDLLLIFPGGLGTIQEIIVPLMHKKLDPELPNMPRGPSAIFIATDEPNPVTEFLPILENKKYISTTEAMPIFPVTASNFTAVLRQWLTSRSLPN